MKDRDKIIEMLAKVDDVFTLETYKKVYKITDEEIAAERQREKSQDQEP